MAYSEGNETLPGSSFTVLSVTLYVCLARDSRKPSNTSSVFQYRTSCRPTPAGELISDEPASRPVRVNRKTDE